MPVLLCGWLAPGRHDQSRHHRRGGVYLMDRDTILSALREVLDERARIGQDEHRDIEQEM